jgi:hypothetical protein
MKNLIATAAAVGLLMTGTAYAAQTTLSDQQMDAVTAGREVVSLLIYVPPMIGPEFSDEHWPGGYTTPLQYQALFGTK